MKRYSSILILLVGASLLWAQTVDITQIENRHLLLDGTLDLYFLPRDSDGNPAALKDSSDTEGIELFSISTDGAPRRQKILDLDQQAPRSQGIHFLLLIDNSGSMHEESLGGDSRYATAIFAVREFLREVNNPLDRVGLAAFNTDYTLLAPIGPVSADHSRALDQITVPGRAQSFTELYRSAIVASGELAAYKGRRAMIILSDGENYPYVLSGSPHPSYGMETVEYEEVISAMIAEGIGVYAVHIGEKEDPLLDTIAKETGGRSFRAASRQELSSVYGSIRDEIRREYRLSFRPPYTRERINELELSLGSATARGRYFVPHFLGIPAAGFMLWFLLPLGIGLVIALLLPVLIREHPAQTAEINVVGAGGRFSNATRVDLGQEKTVIGSSTAADMTIAGNPNLRDAHATIVYSKSAGNYTVQSEGEFRVNNRIKKNHILKSGDVIDLEGTTIVFDKPT